MTSPEGEWTRRPEVLAIPYHCIYDICVSLWRRNLMGYRELPRGCSATIRPVFGQGIAYLSQFGQLVDWTILLPMD